MTTGSANLLSGFFGERPIFNNCIIVLPGANIVGSVDNSINTINEFSPELANLLNQGLFYPQLAEKINNLAQDIATIKNANQQEKPSLIKRLADNMDNIKKISDGTKELKPYAQMLYAGIKASTGIDLPDWTG